MLRPTWPSIGLPSANYAAWALVTWLACTLLQNPLAAWILLNSAAPPVV